MNLSVTTIIGTRMTIEEIAKYLQSEPMLMNSEITKTIREICVSRGYFNKTTANKIKLYRVVERDIQSLTDGQQVMLEVIKTGNQWLPDIAFLFSDFKSAEQVVNAKYPYGEMDPITRKKYINDLSDELSDKFFKVDLLN